MLLPLQEEGLHEGKGLQVQSFGFSAWLEEEGERTERGFEVKKTNPGEVDRVGRVIEIGRQEDRHPLERSQAIVSYGSRI